MIEVPEQFGRFSRQDLEEIAGHRLGESPRVGFGAKAALIVVDMERSVVRRYPHCKAAADHVAVLLDAARQANCPIFYTRGGRQYFSVSFAPLTDAEKGIYGIKARPDYERNPLTEEEFEIADEIAPRPGEVVYTKPRSSAFLGTFLHQLLTWYRVDTLLVTGMSTTGCHSATVRDAFSNNYRTIIPYECCAMGGGHPAQHYLSLLHMDGSHADVVALSDALRYLQSGSVGAASEPREALAVHTRQ
jgi:maleamate amidohydrolase